MSFVTDNLTSYLECNKIVLLRGAKQRLMLEAVKPFIPEGMSFYTRSSALRELAESIGLRISSNDKSTVLWGGDLSTQPDQEVERLWYLQLPGTKVDDRAVLSKFDLILGFKDNKLCERIVHVRGDF